MNLWIWEQGKYMRGFGGRNKKGEIQLNYNLKNK